MMMVVDDDDDDDDDGDRDDADNGVAVSVSQVREAQALGGRGEWMNAKLLHDGLLQVVQAWKIAHSKVGRSVNQPLKIAKPITHALASPLRLMSWPYDSISHLVNLTLQVTSRGRKPHPPFLNLGVCVLL
jgi:hypothetical protein